MLLYVRRTLLAIVVVLAGAAGGPGPTSATPTPAGTAGRSLYIVQVAGQPLAAYEGGVSGIPGTRPREGAKLDTRAWSYQAYRKHLQHQRAQVLRSAGVPAERAVTAYTTAFNGFAARLSAEEKTAIERTPGVVRVWKNEKRTVETATTPAFLGLSGTGGVWQQHFGDPARAGEGIIVGVVDTGFWPESPSLAALPEPRPDANLIHEKWYADGIDKCDEGEGGPAEQITCNNKVIGARSYDLSGFGDWADEFSSPRDYDGHGTHTATTAAGLAGVPATINGDDVGPLSGMAPASRIAVYKALWRQSDGEGSGGTVDLMQAVDDAVTDGVDIINYSVSGSSTYVVDPIELAFFNAAAAGVFIAASAGNSGPDASTVAHNAPWVTTVAASSHDRGAAKKVTLGNGKTYDGAGQGPALPAAPLADAATSGLATADPTKLELCYSGMLDPAKVKGKIVICKRGVNSRTDKSIAVRDAGGVGMILYNPTVNSLNADFHVVPTIHVGPAEGTAIKAYLKGQPNATAALSAVSTATPRSPDMGAFSSAGPAVAGSGDLLKPDITAPGVDIVAGVSPAGHHGNTFDGLSGTSMSAPHIAGIAALLRSEQPSWSPSTLRSALMTTAGTVDNTGNAIQRDGKAATPLDYGAGHVRPGRAFDPGLVYDSTPQDWARYACGIDQLQLVSDWCDTVGRIDPSDLNYPSIAVSGLPGKQTVTRTVTNVTREASVYVAKAKAPAGFEIKVVPDTITVPGGGTATFEVHVTRTGAPYKTWAFGDLTWTDLRGHVVRSPIAVKPVALAGPGEVSGSGAAGSTTVEIRGGYRGTVTAKAYGLVASTPHTARLAGSDMGFDPAAPAASATVHRFTESVPSGARLARFATYGDEHAPGSDIDLYVYKDGELVASSVSGTSDEEISLVTAGKYDVYVVQFAVPLGTPAQDVKAHAFVVRGPGGLTVSPQSRKITPDEVVPFTVAWSGLTAGRRMLGMVEFGDGTTAHAWTTVAVRP